MIPVMIVVITVDAHNIDYAHKININTNEIANNADDNNNDDDDDMNIFYFVSVICCQIIVVSVRLIPPRLYCVATMRTEQGK